MKLSRTIFSAAFLAHVSIACLCLAPSVFSRDVLRAATRKTSVKSAVAERVRNEMPLESSFVLLNGGACRAIGRRLCNKRVMCGNGVVCESRISIPSDSGTAGCEYTRWLNGVCKGRGIPFVFVVAPAKADAGRTMFPRGWDCGGDVNSWAHARCEEFRAEGMEVVDLTSRYTATPADVRRNFFKTDHHWNIRAAFDAAHVVANKLSEVLSLPALRNHPHSDPANWEWRMMRDSFVGSHGRRTGAWFSGLDDFEYAVPRFKTHMARELFRTGAVWEGAFEDSVITKSRLEETGKEMRYSIVCGGDSRWLDLQRVQKDRRMRISNFLAPCEKRVMISQDSFGLPFAAYLSPLFKETLVNDPRNMPPGLDEEKMIADYRPDVVIRIVYATTLAVKH